MFTVKIPKKYTSSPKFARYVLAKLVNDIQGTLLASSYKLMDKVVTDFLGVSNNENTAINCYSLVSYYIRTFSIADRDEYVEVGDITGTERVVNSEKTISSAVRLMEYGATGVPPVPRVTRVINNIQNNLDKIYKEWLDLNSRK